MLEVIDAETGENLGRFTLSQMTLSQFLREKGISGDVVGKEGNSYLVRVESSYSMLIQKLEYVSVELTNLILDYETEINELPTNISLPLINSRLNIAECISNLQECNQ